MRRDSIKNYLVAVLPVCFLAAMFLMSGCVDRSEKPQEQSATPKGSSPINESKRPKPLNIEIADNRIHKLIEAVSLDGSFSDVMSVKHYTVSPSGKKVVFVGQLFESNDKTDLWVVDSDATGLKRLTNDGKSSEPHWPQFEELISFLKGGELYFSNLNSGSSKRLDLYNYQKPQWSPNGRAIALERDFRGSTVVEAHEWRQLGEELSINQLFSSHYVNPSSDSKRGAPFEWDKDNNLILRHDNWTDRIVFDWDKKDSSFNPSGYYLPEEPIEIKGYKLSFIAMRSVFRPVSRPIEVYFKLEKLSKVETDGDNGDNEDNEDIDAIGIGCAEQALGKQIKLKSVLSPMGIIELEGAFLEDPDPQLSFENSKGPVVLKGVLTIKDKGKVIYSKELGFGYYVGD